MIGYVFKSNFSLNIEKFLTLKYSTGYKYSTSKILIEQFDDFCFSNYARETLLTEEIGLAWVISRPNESFSSLTNRIVVVREFAKYLNSLDISAFLIPTTYIPKGQKYRSYIYSNIELKNIFSAIDNGEYSSHFKATYIVLPLFFRTLYCCGLRISEAINLKVENVDLDNGIIAIYEAKNDNDRLVPLSNELKSMYIDYYNKMHSDSSSDDFFFYIRKPDIPMIKANIHRLFGIILALANIEKSKQNNPRIHDFRHTFAVNCLKKFVLENKDLSAYLPILKTYMGHSKFISTEYYLKLTNNMFPDILNKTSEYIQDAIPVIGGNNEK